MTFPLWWQVHLSFSPKNYSFWPGPNGVDNAFQIKGLISAFWRGFLARSSGTMKMGLYARVSTHDQQTLTLQREAMTAYAKQRGGSIVVRIEDVGSGVSDRLRREELMRAARRREIDAIVVWRLDRWGRSLVDLITTLQELQELGVGFISLHEALDFTTPTGRAMAGMLAVFAEFERGILRERVKAGIAEARRRGKQHGRPPTVARWADEVRQLHAEGLSKSAIARQLGISRTSVRRFLN
jgi:DNA invertase Pin-like site-specific DNA recombinase